MKLLVIFVEILFIFNGIEAQSFVCGAPHQGIGLVVGGDVVRKKDDFPW